MEIDEVRAKVLANSTKYMPPIYPIVYSKYHPELGAVDGRHREAASRIMEREGRGSWPKTEVEFKSESQALYARIMLNLWRKDYEKDEFILDFKQLAYLLNQEKGLTGEPLVQQLQDMFGLDRSSVLRIMPKDLKPKEPPKLRLPKLKQPPKIGEKPSKVEEEAEKPAGAEVEPSKPEPFKPVRVSRIDLFCPLCENIITIDFASKTVRTPHNQRTFKELKVTITR